MLSVLSGSTPSSSQRRPHQGLAGIQEGRSGRGVEGGLLSPTPQAGVEVSEHLVAKRSNLGNEKDIFVKKQTSVSSRNSQWVKGSKFLLLVLFKSSLSLSSFVLQVGWGGGGASRLLTGKARSLSCLSENKLKTLVSCSVVSDSLQH